MRIGRVQACTLGTFPIHLQQLPELTDDSLSAVQFCSIIFGTSSLIAAAVILFLTGACYGTISLNVGVLILGIAAMKGQEFTSSKTLGGQGVAQMIV
jgi:hypothetical protein